jgi:hypothetical protein
MVSSSCSTDGTSWCHRKYAIIVNLSFEKSAENVNGRLFITGPNDQ